MRLGGAAAVLALVLGACDTAPQQAAGPSPSEIAASAIATAPATSAPATAAPPSSAPPSSAAPTNAPPASPPPPSTAAPSTPPPSTPPPSTPPPATPTPSTYQLYGGPGFTIAMPRSWTWINLDDIPPSTQKAMTDNPGFIISATAVQRFKSTGGVFLAFGLTPSNLQSSSFPWLEMVRSTSSSPWTIDSLQRAVTTALAQNRDVVQPAEVVVVTLNDGRQAVRARYRENNFQTFSGSLESLFVTEVLVPNGATLYDLILVSTPADDGFYRPTFTTIGLSLHLL